MSVIDRHVSAVRNRLALGLFVRGLGLGLAVVGGAAVLTVLSQRLTSYHLPGGWWTAGAGVGLAFAAAVVFAIRRRPNSLDAAVSIDHALNLKERLSTAMAIR